MKNAAQDAALIGIGITASNWIRTEEIHFSPEIRAICAGNTCRNYEKTWACPPATGTFDQCREQILNYPAALVFTSVYPLEDSFDYEGMQKGHRAFKQVCDRLYQLLEGDFLLLSNEGCIRCQSCTYPEKPCRFPQMLFPALEGYGILVNRLAASAGIPYIAGPNTVTYFGLLCCSDPSGIFRPNAKKQAEF